MNKVNVGYSSLIESYLMKLFCIVNIFATKQKPASHIHQML